MPTYTPNLNLAKPLVNDPTDQDLWGSYINSDLDTIDSILGKIYPVGSLYFNASVATNPATLLGFGTWTAFAQGRVPVGVGTGTDANADTLTVGAGDSLGEYNHILSLNEIPTHQHKLPSIGDRSGTRLNTPSDGGGATIIYQNVYSDFAGGGLSHNNVQPYIGVYIWQRTA
jgi:hypothetical protein